MTRDASGFKKAVIPVLVPSELVSLLERQVDVDARRTPAERRG